MARHVSEFVLSDFFEETVSAEWESCLWCAYPREEFTVSGDTKRNGCSHVWCSTFKVTASPFVGGMQFHPLPVAKQATLTKQWKHVLFVKSLATSTFKTTSSLECSLKRAVNQHGEQRGK